MGTRSEIRIYKEKKLNSCTYHHYDGYPEHILRDISQLNKGNANKTIKLLSKKHGTIATKCAYGNKSEKHQGDIEYSYNVHFNDKKSPGKVEIFHHKFSGGKQRPKRKIFSGSLSKAKKKFLK